MKEKIEFRAIPDVDDDEMASIDANYDGRFVYGSLMDGPIPCIVGEVVESSENGVIPAWWVPVKRDTIGQYVGRKDVNGKRIYVGSIVEKRHLDDETGLPFGECLNGIVVYEPKGARYLLDLIGQEKNIGIYYKYSQYTVIGNVYENPELLEAPHGNQ
ncbi:YopX family protein [Lactiplantibacillus mudanjiangensis]|uniref:YopX protein domain-containing protein n=1 Tax=Lactiplantibacillus mudanjiangensis TaxID=1296538 RepID=A0A660E4G8_9LACO|nr:YopX family protein [Lactiplantibacillus mudanjiangensis]VDG23687.1 Hypothetical protein [Lactobacillus casei LOCK919] [Lactiplantibacillus mudanjiangensis]VDG27830.1 Hypothetical protein [Lactobacillus casei LOCK919] [Lactiplantibacillus mudanjiangensis]